ncbi:MAG TPA: hypothetical protein VFC75_02405 [Erysipelothrix sp.]|nr:hypothetical protein [Erysipelothrix sp.]
MIKSMELGQYYGLKYQTQTLDTLIDDFNLTIIHFEGSKAESKILGYYEKNTIYLNQQAIHKVNQLMHLELEDLVIAHEFFHHLEIEKGLKEIHTYNSEISAEHFAKTYLSLSFDPSMINNLLKTL